MKKLVIPVLSCMLSMQVFAFKFPADLGARANNLPFALTLPEDFDDKSANLSALVEDQIQYNTPPAAATNWRESVVFIELETAQQEVMSEGGGPRQLIDGKTAVAVYETTHRHTCLGAISAPGNIVTARGCFYTAVERTPHSKTTFTIINEKDAFPSRVPLKVVKASAKFKTAKGAVIMSIDATALVRSYFTNAESEGGLLSWNIQTAAPKFTLPSPAQEAALWQNAVFVSYDKGTSYQISQARKNGAEGNYVLLDVRKEKTAGDLVISQDGKYLLGVNRRGKNPGFDLGITAVRRPQIITTNSERKI